MGVLYIAMDGQTVTSFGKTVRLCCLEYLLLMTAVDVEEGRQPFNDEWTSKRGLKHVRLHLGNARRVPPPVSRPGPAPSFAVVRLLSSSRSKAR